MGVPVLANRFGRNWTYEDLKLLADTIEVGLEARASRNKHTGDLTANQKEVLKSTVSNIRHGDY
jgi:hypothetical protein